MIENRETQMRRGTQAVLICLCIFFLMSDVLLPMIPLTDRREFLTLHRVLCFSMLSLVLARLPKNSGRTGALLLAVNWIWLMIARLLAGCLSDTLPNEITRAGALCAVFYLTRSLDARGRSRLSAWFCGVFFPKKKSRLCSRQLFFFFTLFYFRIKRIPSVLGPQWLVTVDPASVSRISANGGS